MSTRGVPRETALTDPDEHEFFVPEDARWSVITGKAMGLGEALNVASHAVEDANTGRLDGVLTGVNWNDEQKLGSPANRESLIRQLLNHFAGLDLSNANLRDGQVDAGNVLGDAYEYLIYQFADDAGKKGGEFYTPLAPQFLRPPGGRCPPAEAELLLHADWPRDPRSYTPREVVRLIESLAWSRRSGCASATPRPGPAGC